MKVREVAELFFRN